MTESEFIVEIARIINLIAESVEKQDLEGDIDVDINGDILNINTQEGMFVINKQTSTREIWLSSPISGPYHFILKNRRWCVREGDAELFNILSRDLKMKIID